MKKLDINEQFLNYYNRGLDDTKIGTLLNASRSTIRNLRLFYNLPTVFKYTSKVDKSKLIECHSKGMSDVEIAKEFELSDRQVGAKRRKFGLGKIIPSKFRNSPTQKQRQIIIGGLLGDSSMSKTIDSRISFEHCIEQIEYAKWKENMLESLEVRNFTSDRLDKRTGRIYNSYSVYSLNNIHLNEFYEEFYKESKSKRVPEKYLTELNELGLSVWFMDDGYKSTSGGYYLATNSFNYEEQLLLIKYLKKNFNLQCSLHGGKIENKHRIYIKKESAKLFEKLVKDFMHKDMIYKLHN